VTDEIGRVMKRFAFDAWGKRVDPTTNATIVAATNTEAGSSTSGKFTRGYTDHEHLDDLGLIHMNGRVYDPVLGRFLSADPFVGDVRDSQDYNRYSYVGNNPLNATDPSGYFSLKDGVKFVAVAVVAIVAAYYLGPLIANGMLHSVYGAGIGVISPSIAGAYGAAGAGLAGGFASGFAGSLLNGGSVGDAFRAGAIGGAIGSVSGFVGAKAIQNLPDSLAGLSENSISEAATEGFINGATAGALDTVAYGGNFGGNVARSAFTTSASYGGAEAAQTLWSNYKIPSSFDKEIDRLGLTPEQSAALKGGFRSGAKANSITAVATLLGGAIGAGAGYAIGRDSGSAAAGAVIGGGAGFYTSGIDIRAVLTVTADRGSQLDSFLRSELFVKLPVRNLGVSDEMYGSLNVSVAPVFFGKVINQRAFGAFGWGSHSGQLSKAGVDYGFQYFSNTGAHNTSIPRWGFWRGGR
jgi:RHS repeat-associated protein